MNKKAAFLLGCMAVAVMPMQLSGAIPRIEIVGSSHAAEKFNFNQAISLAGGQRMLTQRMSKELLLVSLGYNTRENLRNLRSNHRKFERVLKALRFGDPELAIESTDNPEVIANLARVEEIWPLFNSALQEGIGSGEVADDSVGLVSDLSLPLLSAMNDVVKSYENAAHDGALFSMVGIALNLAGRQRMLTQKMAKEFLLITYGEDVAANRRRLSQTMSLFEETLEGLMTGDSELRLIPAPDPRIQAQLLSVKRLWQETKPILEIALRSDKIDEDDVADVASLNLSLLTEMGSAVSLYGAL